MIDVGESFTTKTVATKLVLLLSTVTGSDHFVIDNDFSYFDLSISWLQLGFFDNFNFRICFIYYFVCRLRDQIKVDSVSFTSH